MFNLIISEKILREKIFLDLKSFQGTSQNIKQGELTNLNSDRVKVRESKKRVRKRKKARETHSRKKSKNSPNL